MNKKLFLALSLITGYIGTSYTMDNNDLFRLGQFTNQNNGPRSVSNIVEAGRQEVQEINNALQHEEDSAWNQACLDATYAVEQEHERQQALYNQFTIARGMLTRALPNAPESPGNRRRTAIERAVTDINHLRTHIGYASPSRTKGKSHPFKKDTDPRKAFRAAQYKLKGLARQLSLPSELQHSVSESVSNVIATYDSITPEQPNSNNSNSVRSSHSKKSGQPPRGCQDIRKFFGGNNNNNNDGNGNAGVA